MSAVFTPADRNDFAIVGSTKPDGTVRIIASRDLGVIDLAAEFAARHSLRLSVAMNMGDTAIIDAPDYPSALAELARRWGGRYARRPGVGGQRQIGAGEA